MIRRRPIARTKYRWRPEPKPDSLQWELIESGAIRRHKASGREVCQPNASGSRIYSERVREMVQRQNYRCSLCQQYLTVAEATFEHHRRRGMGAAFRDDRILNEQGTWMNSAAHWNCNMEKG